MMLKFYVTHVQYLILLDLNLYMQSLIFNSSLGRKVTVGGWKCEDAKMKEQ